MKIRAGKKLWRRKPTQAPATIAERIAASTFPSDSASTANVTPEMPQTPDASPSSPSRKLTMFITATIQRTVSGTPTQAGRSTAPTNGKREVVDPDAERGRDRRGQHLAGELRHRREAAEVVDRADDARDRRADHDAAHLARQVEEGERRHEDAEEDREPAEPRDRAPVEPPPVRLVDDAEEPRHAADRGRERDHDHERDRRSVEHLGVLPEVIEHCALYFVP